jgi:hypothetical protein
MSPKSSKILFVHKKGFHAFFCGMPLSNRFVSSPTQGLFESQGARNKIPFTSSEADPDDCLHDLDYELIKISAKFLLEILLAEICS